MAFLLFDGEYPGQDDDGNGTYDEDTVRPWQYFRGGFLDLAEVKGNCQRELNAGNIEWFQIIAGEAGTVIYDDVMYRREERLAAEEAEKRALTTDYFILFMTLSETPEFGINSMIGSFKDLGSALRAARDCYGNSLTYRVFRSAAKTGQWQIVSIPQMKVVAHRKNGFPGETTGHLNPHGEDLLNRLIAIHCKSPEPEPEVEPVPRLVIDPEVSTESPVIRGTWVTVSHIVSLILDGWTWADILHSHPELTEDDIRAATTHALTEENS